MGQEEIMQKVVFDLLREYNGVLPINLARPVDFRATMTPPSGPTALSQFCQALVKTPPVRSPTASSLFPSLTYSSGVCGCWFGLDGALLLYFEASPCDAATGSRAHHAAAGRQQGVGTLQRR